ncbi:MAG TPA: hypothetical protein VNY83_03990 [Solirubrobacterales bacterium]|jgi:hypothetical protein|nr:hypothetical protein [Solirubrobacterales bacterium]
MSALSYQLTRGWPVPRSSEVIQWLSPHGYDESVSYQTQRQRVLTPGEVAKLPAGNALLLRGRSGG